MDQQPKWVKELDTGDEDLVDPFARGSADPRGSGEAEAAPATTGPGIEGPTGETGGEQASVADLVSGRVPDSPWQSNPYDRNSSTWLAAAQRRHQHRRRSNALLGVAAVDLSGPREPTPMIGQRLGNKPGHYFVVLTIEVDRAGYCSTESQTEPVDGAPAGPAVPPDSDDAAAADTAGADDEAPPLWWHSLRCCNRSRGWR